jgi:hypothetical protein
LAKAISSSPQNETGQTIKELGATMESMNKYSKKSVEDIEKELNRYDLLISVLRISGTASVTGTIFFIFMMAIGSIAISEVTIIILLFLLILMMASITSAFRENRNIKQILKAMLANDIGLYIPTVNQRRRLGLEKKFMPFDNISSICINGELWIATLTTKDGFSATLSKRLMPDLVAFEKRYKDRIKFVKDRCILWDQKRRRELEFFIVKRAEFEKDSAMLELVEGTTKIMFDKVSDIRIITLKGSTKGVEITFSTDTRRGFISFNKAFSIDLMKAWKRYVKAQIRSN